MDKKHGTKRSAQEVVWVDSSSDSSSNDNDGENHEPRSKKANNNNNNSKATINSKTLAPLEPRVDPFESLDGSKKTTTSQFVLYLAVSEPTDQDSPFAQGLAKCAAACPADIQSSCFQRDGTRHVTLWQGSLTWEQASRIKQPTTSSSSSSNFWNEPIAAEIIGLSNWNSGIYLELSKSCTQQLVSHVLDPLWSQGLLPKKGGRKSCNHLSLYRKRNAPAQKATAAFANIRKAVAHHDWGTIDGISIRIKPVGSEYDECSVLWWAAS